MTIYNPTYTYNVPNQFKLSIDIRKEVANILIEVPILKKYQSTNINTLSYILKSYYFKIFVSSLSIMKHILYNIYSLEKNIQFVLQIVYVLIKVHWAVPTASRIFFFLKKQNLVVSTWEIKPHLSLWPNSFTSWFYLVIAINLNPALNNKPRKNYI